MYTTILHDLRRHLHLSLSEYCVLDAIYHLQNKEKYGFWCVASHQTIADNIGLSKDTVKRCYNTLLERKYIKEGGLYKGKTKKVRVSQNECDLFNHSKKAKALVFDDGGSITPVVQPALGDEDRGQNAPGTEGILHPDRGQNALQYKQYINKDTNILPDGNSEPESHDPPGEEKKEYGKEEINQMLKALAEEVGVDEFKESHAWQRRYGKNMVSLRDRIGRSEFRRRFDAVLADEFRSKNANSLKYLYAELKSAKKKSVPRTVSLQTGLKTAEELFE